MQKFTSHEKHFVANTLSCVPIILKGQAVLIDLLNENSVAGRIESADGLMNIQLTNVVYIDRNGNQYPFEEFMIRSRMIRQIHIPGNIDMQKEIENWIKYGLNPRREKRKTGKRTFKQKRAEERHKEIVQEIIKAKEDET